MDTTNLPRLGLDYETLHVHADDFPFVTYAGGVRSRILHARPDEGLVVAQSLVPAGDISNLHQHTAPLFGWTNSGTWGHDLSFGYRPGSYIYERPNVPHRFFAGPDVCDILFIGSGSIQDLDDDSGEVLRTTTPPMLLEGYFQACETEGLPRPNIPA